MTPLPCPHRANVRDCGECGAEAHRAAVERARFYAVGVANGPLATQAASELSWALAAQEGHRLLRENGIASCFALPKGPAHVCGQPGCPGRAVRFELPEVRP